MQSIWGIIRYEYRMSTRRLGFWLGFLLASTPYLFAIELNPATMTDFRPLVGRTVYLLNLFMPVVAGILVADRLVRDRRLGVDQIIQSTPLKRIPYIVGKYFGNLLAILTPPLILVLVLGIASSVIMGSLTCLGWFLVGYVAIIVPAYAFITIFSLACPMIMPVRVYQVLFTGYWIWGNYLSPEAFPTLAGTLLTPGGEYVLEGFFRNSVGNIDPSLLHTPTEAVLNLAIIFACIVAATVVLERYLAQRAKVA